MPSVVLTKFDISVDVQRNQSTSRLEFTETDDDGEVNARVTIEVPASRFNETPQQIQRQAIEKALRMLSAL